MTFVKPRFIVTHTISQTDIPAVELQTDLMSKRCGHKELLVLKHFHKNITCSNVAVVRIGQALAVTLTNCVSVGYDKLLIHER